MVEALAASAALLLVVSGIGKLRRPAPAAVMLRTVAPWLPLRTALASARVAGGIEMAVGAASVVLGGPVALGLLAGVYVVLAGIALRLFRLGRVSGQRVACGCFGTSDTPVGPAHLALDVLCAAAAGMAAVLADARFAGLGDRSAPVAVVAGLQIVLLVWLAYLCVTALPALAAARRLITPMKGRA